MPTIEPLYATLTNRDLDEFEKATGLSLPALYREFLKKNNGGESDADVFDVPDGWGTTVVNRFFGIQQGAMYDLFKDWRRMKRRIPSHLLAIAEDPAGNRIIMETSGANAGKIYLWDHERQPPDEERTENPDDYPNIHPVAANLDAFLKILRTDDGE